MKLNGGRHVQGILRGFDPFMNLVVDETLEMGPGGQQSSIGMVVSGASGREPNPNPDPGDQVIVSFQVIRGNSIIMLEALERV